MFQHWLIESPVLKLLECITPSDLDEYDEDYVSQLQQFIADTSIENAEHFEKIGSYRMDLFIAGEYAFMKLRTYVDGGLDPDSTEGQRFMFMNYMLEFSQVAEEFAPLTSPVTIVSDSDWQQSLVEDEDYGL